MKYNANKIVFVIFRSATLKGCFIPEFKLKGVTVHVVATYKYLGNYIFSICSLEVKLTLFRSYCSPIYGVPLWWRSGVRLHIAQYFKVVYWYVKI